MSVSYDVFTRVFLDKISEYDFLRQSTDCSTRTIDGFMKRALSSFRKNCKYNFYTTMNNDSREFDVDIPADDLIEIAEIVSDGMIVQWLKPFVNQQDILENVLNTRDFTRYSPAELLLRVGNAYEKAQKDYTRAIREYSFNHGDLTDLHI